MNKTTFTTPGKNTIRATLSVVPSRFELYDSTGQLYYFRDLAPGQDRINFNIAKPDTFTANVPGDYKVYPLEIPKIKFTLPPVEKNFEHKKIIYRYNPELKGTPARHFYRLGIIEYGNDFLKLPFPVRVFILCHELGHCYYHNEEHADAYGTMLYLLNGYNATTALHSLTDVLNFESNQNKSRLKKQLKRLSK